MTQPSAATRATPPASAPPAATQFPRLDQPQDIEHLSLDAQNAFAAGTSLAARRGIGPDELKARLEAAGALCAKSAFDQALPTALGLFALDPQDWRFGFLAGSCLQRLHRPRAAAVYFGAALSQSAHPAIAFRFAECLASLGHRDEAAIAFDNAATLAKDDPEQARLHAQAVSTADALRKAVPSAARR